MRHKSIIVILSIFVMTVFFGASIDALGTGTTIAYLGDARPSKFGTAGITELTNDLNHVIPQSPTGNVDAIFMIGDMDKISQTQQAYAASNVKDIPVFYVVGNHEVGTRGDVKAIRALFSTSKIPLSPCPLGTDKTTYSLDVGDKHIINTNIYWDGNSNGKCDWYSPGTTDVSDDTCLKYSSGSGGDGGYIPDALYNWINGDLSKTSSWKIVVGHEPMYPKTRHVGDSLDKDPANRDKLQDLFVSQKVAVYVAAHTHYASVNNVGGVYHVDAGVSGQKIIDGDDPYASIFYTHTNSANDLILTWTHENPTWNSPATASYTIKNVISSSNSPINITSFTPLSPVNDKVGVTQTFRITANQTVNLKWYINGTLVGSNSSVTGGNYTNTSAKSGTWNLSAVADNSNGSAAKTWIWKVSDVIANAGGPYTGTPGTRINFTGSASGGAAPYSYNWNFGDGGTSSLANPAHVYSNRGYYTASLTVTDNAGRVSSPDAASVSVEWLRFINGTIRDSVNKTGLSGVRVSTNTSLSTITNSTGFYSFPVNSGIYNITATFEPEYYPNSTKVSTEFTNVVVQDIGLLNKPVGTIQGTVRIG